MEENQQTLDLEVLEEKQRPSIVFLISGCVGPVFLPSLTVGLHVSHALHLGQRRSSDQQVGNSLNLGFIASLETSPCFSPLL